MNSLDEAKALLAKMKTDEEKREFLRRLLAKLDQVDERNLSSVGDTEDTQNPADEMS